MKRISLVVFLVLGSALNSAVAAEVKVLSGGAVEPGLHAFAALVKRDLGHDLKIQFNTTPQIVKRLAAGDVYDIVIVTPPVIEQAIKDGKLAADGRAPVPRRGLVSEGGRRRHRVSQRAISVAHEARRGAAGRGGWGRRN